MNTLKGLNDAIEYIESNLCNEIDFNAIYKIAACSEYHFKRVFSYFAMMPIGEYIRARRLSVAVDLLQSGNKKVVDVALMLGYATPEAFARAFRAMHGVNPLQAKNKGTKVKVFLPLALKLSVSGGIEMKVRIVQKEVATHKRLSAC